jgi:hypothetical protein
MEIYKMQIPSISPKSGYKHVICIHEFATYNALLKYNKGYASELYHT